MGGSGSLRYRTRVGQASCAKLKKDDGKIRGNSEVNCRNQLSKSGVSVEKVSQLMLVVVQASRYKQANAVVHHYIWRPAAYDGTPFPRGVAVLLLPARRSCS